MKTKTIPVYNKSDEIENSRVLNITPSSQNERFNHVCPEYSFVEKARANMSSNSKTRRHSKPDVVAVRDTEQKAQQHAVF
jgi:hypothetical protein